MRKCRASAHSTRTSSCAFTKACAKFRLNPFGFCTYAKWGGRGDISHLEPKVWWLKSPRIGARGRSRPSGPHRCRSDQTLLESRVCASPILPTHLGSGVCAIRGGRGYPSGPIPKTHRHCFQQLTHSISSMSCVLRRLHTPGGRGAIPRFKSKNPWRYSVYKSRILAVLCSWLDPSPA